MRVLIVEDERDARNIIKLLLAEFFEDTFEIVGEATTITESLTLTREKKPDLVFLDVRLEDGSGLDFLKKLDKIDFQIIFTTAYDHYAIKAIKYAATDYLLKPVNPEEFKIAVQKALDKKQEFEEYLKLQEELGLETEKTISINTTGQTHIVHCNDIIRLEADGAYTLIITKNNKILASKNLKHFEQFLPDEHFIRTHQSHIINKKYISGIKNDFIILENNHKVPLSFRKKTAVKNFLKDKKRH